MSGGNEMKQAQYIPAVELKEGHWIDLAVRRKHLAECNGQALAGVLQKVAGYLEPGNNNLLREMVFAEDVFETPAANDVTNRRIALWFIYRYRYPCRCCGENDVTREIAWSRARKALEAPGSDEFLGNDFVRERVNQEEMTKRDGRWFVSGIEMTFIDAARDIKSTEPRETSTEVGLHPGDDGLCPECSKMLLFRAREISHLEKVREEEEGKEREEQERRAWRQFEARNPKYKTVRGHLNRGEAFDEEVNRMLEQGYTLWGAIKMDAEGNLLQPLIRIDYATERRQLLAEGE